MTKMFKKLGKWAFPLALMVYALIFLCVTAVGLTIFWDFIEAYEVSRPKNTLDGYMEMLTPEYVADRCGDLIATVDSNLQSEQECRAAIVAALDGKFSCAKKNKESTEDHYVYALRCGAKVIGTVEMKSQGEGAFGFTPWQITAESFDLSYLVTESASITVPQECTVSFNGRQLGSEYIVKDKIQYSELKEFYAEFAMPYIVTYEVGPFLGDLQLMAVDASGNPVTVDENTDYNAFLDNCTDEEIAALSKIAKEYIQLYVNLMTNKGGSPYNNYYKIASYIVPNGTLNARIKDALSGLTWITDRYATLKSTEVNAYINVGNGRYVCDITYIVNQPTAQGREDTVTKVKLLFLETNNGLKVEAMKSY